MIINDFKIIDRKIYENYKEEPISQLIKINKPLKQFFKHGQIQKTVGRSKQRHLL